MNCILSRLGVERQERWSYIELDRCISISIYIGQYDNVADVSYRITFHMSCVVNLAICFQQSLLLSMTPQYFKIQQG